MLNNNPNYSILVAPGPEDMVLDTNGFGHRILVSCDSRRENKESGWIYAIDLKTDSTYEINRTNEPQGLVFHPHGMDLVQLVDGTTHLYLVSHDDVKGEQAILEYLVMGKTLRFLKEYTDALLITPNDVCATNQGAIFTGNEFHKRNALLPALLGMKSGNIIRFSNEKWTVQSRGYCYANGVAVYGNTLLSVATRNRYLYATLQNGTPTDPKEKWCKIPGGDNISVIGDKAYIACHVSLIRFIKHAKNKANTSPTVIYEVDLITHKRTLLYSNNSGLINGASTAIYYQGKLYLSQVFEPIILVVAPKK